MHQQISKKHACREILRERRRQITAPERSIAEVQITERLLLLPELAHAQHIFCYLASKEEVNTTALIEGLHREERSISVPYIAAQKAMQAVVFYGFDNTVPGVLGIKVPNKITALDKAPEVAVIPGLGFSVSGNRIGYGKGYYDQWLSSHQSTLRIAIAFEEQIASDIPVSAHDIPMQIIITPSRTIRIGQ